jgi:3'-5' exoribonuclease
LSHGDTVEDVYLVTDKQLRANRNGNLYLQVELRDKTGIISSRLWNASEAIYRSFNDGDFVTVVGKVQLFQGAPQMILSNISRAVRQHLDLGDYLQQTPRDRDKLLARMKEVLFGIGNPPLRALMECFLIDEEFVDRLISAPAGIKNHHAYVGGLAEHIVNLLETAQRILDLYPAVDPDLLLAGIFLHDIGKVHELSYDNAFRYTDEGQLLGHLVIGVEMLSARARQSEELTGEPFPHELLLRLKHMIVSHHGSYEFGSPKLPMTPEAIALHHLDNLDAKVHNFEQQITGDPNQDSAWTTYDASLGRKLFKGSVEQRGLAASHVAEPAKV